MTVLRYMTDYMTDPHRHDGRRDSLDLCQLAPRVCTSEGKGRTNRSIFQLRWLSVLTTQSWTHIGSECLDFSLVFPFIYTAVLHPFPLIASISPPPPHP